jgi:cation diffusion facilitator CzcD-associated flavoprotein CzcO
MVDRPLPNSSESLPPLFRWPPRRLSIRLRTPVVGDRGNEEMTDIGSVGASGDAGVEHFDVLIVGAGISGIDAAYHLKRECPERSFVVLEGLESFGGTWLTHRYPGVRSDSDLYTFGYEFKPWKDAPIASAPQILSYLGEVIEENELAPHIRYRQQIHSASWSGDDNLWTVGTAATDTGERSMFTAGFLWMCQGYYRHSEGYTPEWPGFDRYSGLVVHPQQWPDDLALEGKKVIVIGSGATAATLIPAIAPECEHVTMLQRSPTYFFSRPNVDEVADLLRELEIPDEWIHEIARRKALKEQKEIAQMSFEAPELIKDELIRIVREQLPPDFDVDTHFTPRYLPGRQRIALVPDGNLFTAISSGKVSVVTDEIETFTPDGIRLRSGESLSADVIITATGFNLNVLGDISFTIDGRPLDLADTVTYRGMMFTGVPNLLWIFGYFRASWTLRADLVCTFTCRLLNHMAGRGAARVTPTLRTEDDDMRILDWVDTENFNPGYFTRAVHLLPRRGSKSEWQHSQDYWLEREQLPAADLDDGCLIYQ